MAGKTDAVRKKKEKRKFAGNRKRNKKKRDGQSERKMGRGKQKDL